MIAKATMDSRLETDTAGGPPADALIETLAEALLHSDIEVRVAAAEKLGLCREQRAAGLLIPLLLDRHELVRTSAAQSLRKLDWRPATDSERAALAVAQNQFEIALKLGAAAIDALMVPARDPHVHNRLAALESLAQITNPRTVDLFIEALKDENEHVRCVAVQALSRVNSTQASSHVAEMIFDRSWAVRAVALDTIGSLKSPDFLDSLRRALRDESPDLQQRAAEILVEMDDPRAIEILRAGVRDTDPTVAAAASTALQRLEDIGDAPPILVPNAPKIPIPGSLSVLEAMLAASHPDLRLAAVEALGTIDDPAAISPLVFALMDGEDTVRVAAADALSALGWQPASPEERALIGVVRERWDEVVGLKENATKPLLLVLNSEEPEIRAHAAVALGRIRDARGVDGLVSLLDDKIKRVRNAAANSLRTFGWEPASPHQRARLGIELEDWQAVSAQGADALDLLVREAQENSTDRSYCETIGHAIATITDPASVQSLTRHVRDGEIAGAAVAALHGIMETAPREVETADLQALAGLVNIVQFQYGREDQTGHVVRSGLKEVNTSKLRDLAQIELGLRKT